MSPTDIAPAPTPGEPTAGVVVGILAWMDRRAWVSWASPDAMGGGVIASGLRRPAEGRL